MYIYINIYIYRVREIIFYIYTYESKRDLKVKITLENQLFRDCEAPQELQFIKDKVIFSPLYSLK